MKSMVYLVLLGVVLLISATTAQRPAKAPAVASAAAAAPAGGGFNDCLCQCISLQFVDSRG
ncbi:Hypothetical protein FKW44_000932, partial [Caligus rogercresseyi]